MGFWDDLLGPNVHPSLWEEVAHHAAPVVVNPAELAVAQLLPSIARAGVVGAPSPGPIDQTGAFIEQRIPFNLIGRAFSTLSDTNPSPRAIAVPGAEFYIKRAGTPPGARFLVEMGGTFRNMGPGQRIVAPFNQVQLSRLFLIPEDLASGPPTGFFTGEVYVVISKVKGATFTEPEWGYTAPAPYLRPANLLGAYDVVTAGVLVPVFVDGSVPCRVSGGRVYSRLRFIFSGGTAQAGDVITVNFDGTPQQSFTGGETAFTFNSHSETRPLLNFTVTSAGAAVATVYDIDNTSGLFPEWAYFTLALTGARTSNVAVLGVA